MLGDTVEQATKGQLTGRGNLGVRRLSKGGRFLTRRRRGREGIGILKDGDVYLNLLRGSRGWLRPVMQEGAKGKEKSRKEQTTYTIAKEKKQNTQQGGRVCPFLVCKGGGRKDVFRTTKKKKRSNEPI